MGGGKGLVQSQVYTIRALHSGPLVVYWRGEWNGEDSYGETDLASIRRDDTGNFATAVWRSAAEGSLTDAADGLE